MADAMIEIFGSKLVVNPVDAEERVHPSPEALLNKIIVKGKKLPPGLTDTDGANSGGEVSDEDEAAEGVEFHQGMELNQEEESRKKKKTVSCKFIRNLS